MGAELYQGPEGDCRGPAFASCSGSNDSLEPVAAGQTPVTIPFWRRWLGNKPVSEIGAPYPYGFTEARGLDCASCSRSAGVLGEGKPGLGQRESSLRRRPVDHAARKTALTFM